MAAARGLDGVLYVNCNAVSFFDYPQLLAPTNLCLGGGNSPYLVLASVYCRFIFIYLFDLTNTSVRTLGRRVLGSIARHGTCRLSLL